MAFFCYFVTLGLIALRNDRGVKMLPVVISEKKGTCLSISITQTVKLLWLPQCGISMNHVTEV